MLACSSVGVVSWSSVCPKVRDRTDALDALGNTIAATGKGFAIGSAVLTSLSLLAAFQMEVDPENTMDFTVSDPVVLSGVLIGAMLPFLFAALTMISVGKAAAEIILEVRRQFHYGVPGLFECIQKASAGTEIPEDWVLETVTRDYFVRSAKELGTDCTFIQMNLSSAYNGFGVCVKP